MRGRGLMLADALATESRIVGSDTGTTASITLRLSRPARIVIDPNVVSAEPPATEEFSTEIVDDRLVVAGDVDNATAPTLETQIARKSRSGTHPLTVDLSSVTHLGSSGLRVLAEALERARQHGTELAFSAPPGSAAHHVLMLVGLPLATEAVADRVE
jgi:anti-anti-sigma factor